MAQHTDKRYDEELDELKGYILEMGRLVQEMIDHSIHALVERDSTLAETVIQQEPEVNKLEIKIDNHCMKLLALRQPAASDLRFIAISLKISTDLERMGDLSVNIAQRTLKLNQEPPLKSYVDLPQMAQAVQKMAKGALDAFLNRDPDKAREVCIRDDAIDLLNKQVYRDVLALMQTDTNAISRGVSILSVSKNLERIADHSTNIAESVIFMVQGKDIRHSGEQGAP